MRYNNNFWSLNKSSCLAPNWTIHVLCPCGGSGKFKQVCFRFSWGMACICGFSLALSADIAGAKYANIKMVVAFFFFLK